MKPTYMNRDGSICHGEPDCDGTCVKINVRDIAHERARRGVKRSVEFRVEGSTLRHKGFEGGSCPIDKIAEIVLSSSVNAITEITVTWVDRNGAPKPVTYILIECPFCDFDGAQVPIHDIHAHDDVWVSRR